MRVKNLVEVERKKSVSTKGKTKHQDIKSMLSLRLYCHWSNLDWQDNEPR